MGMAEDRCKPWMRVEKDKLKKFCWFRCSCGVEGEKLRIEEYAHPHVVAFIEWRVHLTDCPEMEEEND